MRLAWPEYHTKRNNLFNELNYIEFVGVTIHGFLTFTWERQIADRGLLDDLDYRDLSGPNIVQNSIICSRVTSKIQEYLMAIPT